MVRYRLPCGQPRLFSMQLFPRSCRDAYIKRPMVFYLLIADKISDRISLIVMRPEKSVFFDDVLFDLILTDAFLMSLSRWYWERKKTLFGYVHTYSLLAISIAQILRDGNVEWETLICYCDEDHKYFPFHRLTRIERERRKKLIRPSPEPLSSRVSGSTFHLIDA
jgi:hypothetical protein